MNGEIDYKKVLEDLRKKRTAIDQAIASMEALIGEGPSVGVNQVAFAEILPDTFVGQTIVEAACNFLRMAGRPAKSTEQISDALSSGGLRVSRESVASLLMRDSNSTSGSIHKVGRGVWGLVEWYPGVTKRG